MISNTVKNSLLTLAAFAVGVPLAVGLLIYTFLQATSTTLHPDPQAVPSVTQVAPSARWANAAQQSRQHARASLVEQNLPGLSVAVGVDGEIVWSEGLGWANLEKRIPVAPQMRFRIGHASKALTSAGIGLLVEKGRLNLDDEIQKYVPAFPRKEWRVTLRQLMGHVAGVRHYAERDHLPAAPCARASEGLSFFANDPLRFEPETAYGYSTYGWILASAAVEAAANEPFFTFMRTQVFTPLGMTGTMPDAGSEPIADRVTFYYGGIGESIGLGSKAQTRVNYSCFAGAGGFLSTPSDLVRFGMATNTGKLLKPDTVRKLQTPQQLTSGEDTDYGLGWMLETFTLAGEPTRLAGHASRTPLGGSTSFLTFPDRGLVVAVTTNVASKDTKSLASRIAEVFAQQARHAAPR
jgi:serine beta-lactamase-like protein LACTB